MEDVDLSGSPSQKLTPTRPSQQLEPLNQKAFEALTEYKSQCKQSDHTKPITLGGKLTKALHLYLIRCAGLSEAHEPRPGLSTPTASLPSRYVPSTSPLTATPPFLRTDTVTTQSPIPLPERTETEIFEHLSQFILDPQSEDGEQSPKPQGMSTSDPQLEPVPDRDPHPSILTKGAQNHPSLYDMNGVETLNALEEENGEERLGEYIAMREEVLMRNLSALLRASDMDSDQALAFEDMPSDVEELSEEREEWGSHVTESFAVSHRESFESGAESGSAPESNNKSKSNEELKRDS